MNNRHLLIVCAGVTAVTASAPAAAQRKTHGAGVNWSGGHGGVSWDGGHAYTGGDYGGYPAAPPASPTYKPLPPAYRTPQLAAPLLDPTRSDGHRRHASPPMARNAGADGKD